jgi:sec-independent protein translocase protein TatC
MNPSYLDGEVYATFWDHAEELRRMLFRILVTIAIGLGIALLYYQPIITFLKKPFGTTNHPFVIPQVTHQRVVHERISNPNHNTTQYVLGDNASILHLHHAEEISPKNFAIEPDGYLDIESVQSHGELMIFGPIEGMMLIMKVCFFVSLVATAPFWLYFIIRFIAPALPNALYRTIIAFSLLSIVFMALGCLLAFYLTIPIANHYLMTFNEGLGTNLWSLSQYLDYTVFLLLGSGLSFELFLILLLLVHVGRISSTAMVSKRRHFCVGALIIGAILTPPDVLTQLMLAIPLLVLYELAILYARFRGKISSQ